MKSQKINYSKLLINLIKEEMPELEPQQYSSNVAPASQLIQMLIGSHSPVGAAQIAIKYCGNDPKKALDVVNSLLDKVSGDDQAHLMQIKKIINSFMEKKSLV